MSFIAYKTEAGVDITPQPEIKMIGGGAYKFTPDTPPGTHGLMYVLSTGGYPAFVARYFRVEDYYTDKLLPIESDLFGRWRVSTTGGDAYKIVFYQPDGLTVLAKHNLFDAAGAPTVFNPFTRTVDYIAPEPDPGPDPTPDPDPEPTFTVGGTISGGLSGSGLVLRNNGGDDITIAPGATSFTFPTPLPQGSVYNITVFTQPTGPVQVCTVSNGNGTVGAANVTSVSLSCAAEATYTVGGTITGTLSGSGTVLRNNGGDSITLLPGATTFTFPTRLPQGATYNVTVFTQPTNPSQVCTVTSGSGTVGAANVTTVGVACSAQSTYTIGGTISGTLSGSGTVLRNNGGDSITIPPGATSFTFPTALPQGATYNITVFTQPTGPSQVCTISSGSGTVGTSNVTTVGLTCAAQTTYTIGGTISNLSGSGMVLRNNGGNNVTIPPGATSFTFSTALPQGATYNITVLTQPTSPSQVGTVFNGSGTVGTSNVTSPSVNCITQAFTVGGSITGLTASGLFLRNNGADDESVPSGAAAFTFDTPVLSGAPYAVTVRTQPTGQTCTVSSGSGTVGSGNVTTPHVSCVDNGGGGDPGEPPPGLIIWRDSIQAGAFQGGFDGFEVERPIDTEITGSDAAGANLVRVAEPVTGTTWAIKHLGTFDTGGSRAQLGLWSFQNSIFDTQAKSAAGIWVAQEYYFPAAVSATLGPGDGDIPWLNIWDWHTAAGPGSGDRWATSPGMMMDQGGSMRFKFEWGNGGVNDSTALSTIALPVGAWFDLEMYYKWSTTGVTLSVWVNGNLALQQSGAVTKRPGDSVVEMYSKWYGARNGGGTWQPAPARRYTRNVRIGTGRIWPYK